MDSTEFKRMLGAEPRSQDPGFLRARDSTPESRAAAAEADRFEDLLERALAADVPAELTGDLLALAEQGSRSWRRPRAWAMAASLMIAAGAAVLILRLNSGWATVQDYVAEHYGHDGAAMLALAQAGTAAPNIQETLAEFGVTATPELAGLVSVIKICPSPEGSGVHMVLNTDRGLVTLIYMPHTAVSDGEQFALDGGDAYLVALDAGSAAIIGSASQNVSGFGALVHSALRPLTEPG
jgi:hypothetical protein